MSTRGHNKKRNSGLLYEFLVKSISQALVKDDAKRSSAALRVIKRHFKPETELYKEFRLINALVRTTVSSPAVAASIIQEAKAAARSHDVKQLDREKSLLISSINRSIADDDFYDHQVNEYKVFATVQTLLNDWRTPNSDLGRIAQYEDQLVKWLTTEKSTTPDPTLTSEESPGAGRLLMKVMMRKLNEKYSGVLSGEQRQLLKAYALATANDDPMAIRLKLQEIKRKLVGEIDAFKAVNSDNEYINNKLTEARQRLEGEALEQVDDETVTRFMLYTKLSSELTSEEA